ncbi:MAG TPA: DEAD/DEAH box helicase [Dinghuibacter sp.]|uniref:DEAD/DEAH box helicase n=1 Tax=Dinghuibacter sp. TaxID=2024697 RepID=UPI002B68411C|nr:DEAD/DEAH box helicase [Dinghuibacter sp.]HTJ10673.1 DEAD/DEAH box helicase [Dinghuibacter sp.]
MDFIDFGFDDDLMDGIDSMGYVTATPVQEQVIPPILDGRDIIASAQTGTGKTAAFLLPIIHKLLTLPHDVHQVNAMVIVPTRELAIQIAQILEGMLYYTDISSIAVYGGSDGSLFSAEKKALSTGVDILICTPGRMLTHLRMGYVKTGGVKYLVLDEADRMLDMGFYEDIVQIISYLPDKRQNLLFSATMPPKIRDLARRILHDPLEVNIAISKPPERINQQAFVVYEPQKAPLIKYVLRLKEFNSVLIFCSRIQNVKNLYRELKRSNFSVGEIHSDLEQNQREEALSQFRSKRLKILVATDILSRGIDIDDIDLVINYDVPNDGEDYVHRIGRTARAETDGTAYTFITEQEQRKFARIEQLIGKEVNKAKVPDEFGSVPEYNPKSSRGGGGRNSKHKGKGGGRPQGHHGGKPKGGGGQNRGGSGQHRGGGPRPPQGGGPKPQPAPQS